MTPEPVPAPSGISDRYVAFFDCGRFAGLVDETYVQQHPDDGKLLDTELQELTPSGTVVWSWGVSSHIPVS